MLTAEQNDRFTRVGPGTPMGEVMRRYWHPIAASGELNEEEPTKEIRLLGEDLLLYRDLTEKKEVVELLWRIAFADSRIEPHEEYQVRKIANLLHVPHADFIDAKRRARSDTAKGGS